MQGDNFECLSDDGGLKHIDSLLKIQIHSERHGNTGFEDTDVKSLLLLDRAFRVGVGQIGQYLDLT